MAFSWYLAAGRAPGAREKKAMAESDEVIESGGQNQRGRAGPEQVHREVFEGEAVERGPIPELDQQSAQRRYAEAQEARCTRGEPESVIGDGKLLRRDRGVSEVAGLIGSSSIRVSTEEALVRDVKVPVRARRERIRSGAGQYASGDQRGE